MKTHETCTHCACRNPLWKTLKDELFDAPFSSQPFEKKKIPGLQTSGMVFHGGIIRPLIDGAMDTVEAIGMHHGKVVASGSLLHVISQMEAKGISFEQRKLEGEQTLLPGLLEPHVHIVPTAFMAGWLDLGRFENQRLAPVYDVAWLTKKINDAAKDLKEGEWILGKTVDPSFMPFTIIPGGLNEVVTFDLQLLDSIISDKPLLMMSASMHTMYANTKALFEIYYKNESSLKGTYKTFDDYKTATNGQLQEMEGMKPAVNAIPAKQKLQMAEGLFAHFTELFQEASSRGVTFMYDAAMEDKMKELLELYSALHHVPVRIGAAKLVGSQDDANSLKQYKPVSEYSEVYYGNAKIVSDGSNQGLTGYQTEAYCCNPADNTGLFNFIDTVNGVPQTHPTTPPDAYRTLLNTVFADKGWPMMIHANGSRALDFTIEVYKEVIDKTGDKTRRNRIEHCSLLDKTRIDIMKAYNLSPSFLIGHVGYWGYAFKDAIFGEERANELDLCRSALGAGMRISLHSDHEVSPLGPLRMMEQSITRIMEADPDKNVLNEGECLTPEEALRAVTTDAAWQCYAENWVGSLKDGHFADFVILEKDPLHLEKYYMHLRDLKVLETWKDGVQVHQHKDMLQTA